MAATLVAAVLGTLSATEPALATTSQEQGVYQMIIDARAASGVGGLGLSERLSRMAHRHSRRMARERRLFHSCLSCRFQGRKYRSLGENVGAGRSIQEVHRMMMSSSAHQQNILGPSFNRVGVGVVRRGRKFWVTEIFFG